LIFSRSVPKSCLKLLPSKIGTAKRKMWSIRIKRAHYI
jgi:hypothetical protein